MSREFTGARLVTCAITAGTLMMTGCMGALSAEGTNRLEIEPRQYTTAFDAAAGAARQLGYEIEVVDRSNGIIETRPRHAGSAAEPWRIDNDGPSEVGANTVAHRRRKIRIEFTPVGATLDQAEPDPVLRGPAIPGSTFAQERFDLQTCTTLIEMRVWVYLERSFREGVKPSSYSGSLASYWSNPLSVAPAGNPDGPIRDNAQWTPVGRDPAYERTLAGKVAAALAAARGVERAVEPAKDPPPAPPPVG
ncbi:MAG: hypothetical protein EXS03_08380 [Phycisphaerales bacterium]|nr:hypothetical protein [Phycisphaerales bacterium]